VPLAEFDDESGIDSLLGVAARVETIGRGAAFLVAIDFADLIALAYGRSRWWLTRRSPTKVVSGQAGRAEVSVMRRSLR